LVLPRNRFDRVSFDARFQARTALLISSYGGFPVAQAAARRMLPHGSGTILLTGASAHSCPALWRNRLERASCKPSPMR
jgi:hypothetical protein